MRRFGDPSRSAYLNASITGDGTNFPFLSLFNDSNQYYLALFGVGEDQQSSTSIASMVLAQGVAGTTPIPGLPVVSNRTPPAGVVTSGQAVAAPVGNFPTMRSAPFLSWSHDFPFLVLAPGWSLTVYTGAQAAQPFAVDFWWEVLLPDELLNPKIGDPDIDP